MHFIVSWLLISCVTTISALRIWHGYKEPAQMDSRHVTPGLGWGTSSATDEYTTPLCFDSAAGSMEGVIATEDEQFMQRHDVTYKTNSELHFALQKHADATDIASNALQAAARSLLGHTSGQLNHGFEILHSRYYVPVVRYTITDPAGKCQTSPIKALARLARNGDLNNGAIDTFLQVHGTQVVHSVVLGGHLSLFQMRKTEGGQVDVMSQKSTVSMVSSSMHMTILGGQWDAALENSSAATLQQVVDRWLLNVQAGKNLAVLTQHTTPIYTLFPPELQERLKYHTTTFLGYWYKRRSAMAESLFFFGDKLQQARESYSLAGDVRQAQVDALTSVLELVPRFCEDCNEQGTFYNSGFVGMHSVPPALCKSKCANHVLWICEVALPQMELYIAERLPITPALGVQTSQMAYIRDVINLAGEFCNRRETFLSDLQGGPQRASLLQTSLSGPELDLVNVPLPVMAATDTRSFKLGWAVLPVSDVYTVPLCRDENGQLQSVVTTSSKEPLQPMIQTYSSDLELQQAFSGGIANSFANPALVAGLKSLLAHSEGKLAKGMQLLHMTYYVPQSVQALIDPASACWNARLAELETKFDAGNLTDDDIDRFLQLHGSRLANSVTLGGRLDVFHIQKTGAIDLSFMSSDLGGKSALTEMRVHVNVLGGRWTQMSESKPGESITATLHDAVLRWVASVQGSVDLSVLTQTTMPIAALLPLKLRPHIEERVKHATSSWMRSITITETALFLRKLLQEAKQDFEDAWMKSTQVQALSAVVRSLGELCDVADELSKLYDHGFVGMSDESSRPASFTKFCQRTTLWTCATAVPKVQESAGMLESIAGAAPCAFEKQKVLDVASELCKRLERRPSAPFPDVDLSKLD